MAQRQNSYAREAQRNLRDAREATARLEREHREQSIAENGSMQSTAKERMQRKAEAFDALQVGDSLEHFGPQAVVVKKNRKSVVTNTGSRWTRYELTGIK